MNDGHPLFAFAFRGGLWQAPSTFAAVDTAADDADFVWVHLDLADDAAQAWLRCRPWPPNVIEMVAAPIQRGKLFITRDLIYGHLRDVRDRTDSAVLQAGSLSVAASAKLLITGRRIPLLSIEELRRRVEARTVVPTNPFALITEFFRALNDTGEGKLQEASDRFRSARRRVLQSKMPKREGTRLREEIQAMLRNSVEVVRDMAYKRMAMLELTREHPTLFPADEFDRLCEQIHRYAALVEDAQDLAEQNHLLIEELRAQVAEETNRNLYILTAFSAIFLPATLIASIWGMNVTGFPFTSFWTVDGLIVASIAFVVIVLFRFRLF